MNQRIILADNSYTIRRIVELSFQDIENVELFSFESGVGLKDKLLELLPQVVLIDIKLPEFNGYDACKFINNEPSLVNTKVLLMKGGFEPIDEYLLKDLNYEEIITKPFDSKLLETQVIKLLKEAVLIVPMPPISIPEDLDMPTFSDNLDEDLAIETNIDTESFPDNLPEFNEGKESDGISFSDINEEIAKEVIPEINVAEEKNDMSFEEAVAEIETPEILSENELLSSDVSIIDEVEPSEEITQGAYEDSSDVLSNDSDDDFLNPFNDESELKIDEPSINTDEINLKEHIKEHEDDLGIDSLTIEEMRIKSDIENRNKGIDKEDDDFGTDTFGGLEKQPDFDNISFDEEEVVKVIEENKVEEIPEEKIDKSIFEAAEGILNDDISILEEDGNISVEEPVIEEEPIATADTVKSSELEELFGSQEDDIVEEQISEEEPELSVLEVEEIIENVEEEIVPSFEMPNIDNKDEDISFNIVPEIPEVDQVVSTEEKIEEPLIEPEVVGATEEVNLYEQPEVQEDIPEEDIVAEEPVLEVKKTEEPVIEEIAEPIEPKVESNKFDIDMEKVMASVEDKLTIAIKEILWEVIPPLAEKIIKEEISGLKAEIDNKEF